MDTQEQPEQSSTGETLRLTADIVAAYLSNNQVPAADVPGVIHAVHGALGEIREGNGAGALASRPPAVPIKKSVTPDHIICLEDGKKLKMLKRYLRTQYNLSPEEYRAKWGLSADYPMVAPNYAKARSDVAKRSGLGRARAGSGRRRKR